MVNTARIAELIREPEKTEGSPRRSRKARFHHMQSFPQHLVQLVLDGPSTFETAAAAATNRHDFELAVQQALRHRRGRRGRRRRGEPQPTEADAGRGVARGG